MPTYNLSSANTNFYSTNSLFVFGSSPSMPVGPSSTVINGVTFTFTTYMTPFGSGQYSLLHSLNGPAYSAFGSASSAFSITVLISASQSYTANPSISFTASGMTATYTFSNSGQIIWGGYSAAGFGTFTLNSITTNFLCFCENTHIRTPDGNTVVQDLAAGDLVLTADGRAVPVRWVGQQNVDSRLQHPAKVNPVTIRAGALGNGLPKRDLSVSPDHAIEIDGALINAGALVNGTTVTQNQTTPVRSFTYYHVELDKHELILAEGTAAESYIDYGARTAFDNDDGHQDHIAEMPLPRISSARMVPASVRERLEPMLFAAE